MDDVSAANRPPQVAPQPNRTVVQGDPSASAVRMASRTQYNPYGYGPPQRPVYRYYQGQYQNQSQGQYQNQSQGQYQNQSQGQGPLPGQNQYQ